MQQQHLKQPESTQILLQAMLPRLLFNQQILKNMQMVQIHGDILIQIGLMPL